MEIVMENLITEMEKSFFDEPVVDLAIDYLDIGLDMITNSEIIDAIPVVKTFVSLISSLLYCFLVTGYSMISSSKHTLDSCPGRT